jgi:hypothetical protein
MESAARVLKRTSASRWAALALAVAALSLAVAPPHWLHRLVPAQAAVLAALLPEFDVREVTLQTAPWQLTVRAQTRTHEVLHGRVWPPGLDIEAHTPARLVQRMLVLCVASMAWLLWRQTPLQARTATGTLAWWAAWASLTLPLVLAGQMWALVLDDNTPLGWPLALVGASRFFLHGGDLVLCALPLIVLWGSPTHGPMEPRSLAVKPPSNRDNAA